MPARLLDGDDGSRLPTLGSGAPIVRAFSLSSNAKLARELSPAARRLKTGAGAKVAPPDWDKRDRR